MNARHARTTFAAAALAAVSAAPHAVAETAADPRHDVVDALRRFAHGMDGDAATLVALVDAWHQGAADPSGHFLMKNRYEMELTRDGGGWRISRMVIDNPWTDGDVAVMTGGRPSGEKRCPGRRVPGRLATPSRRSNA